MKCLVTDFRTWHSRSDRVPFQSRRNDGSADTRRADHRSLSSHRTFDGISQATPILAGCLVLFGCIPGPGTGVDRARWHGRASDWRGWTRVSRVHDPVAGRIQSIGLFVFK
jgi:hypothetical protein